MFTPASNAVPAGLDEIGRRALEPGGRHPAILVPHRGEPAQSPASLVSAHFSTSRRIRNSSASCSLSMPGPSASGPPV